MVYPALLPLMRTPRLPVVNWTDAPCRFKWTRPFRRKTESGFCTCAITFQAQSISQWHFLDTSLGNDVRPGLEGNPYCFRQPQAPHRIFCPFPTARVRDRVVALHAICSLTDTLTLVTNIWPALKRNLTVLILWRPSPPESHRIHSYPHKSFGKI
jgi:hypothetical protein